MKIDVLDNGFVRLVEHMGDDLSIVRAARSSYTSARCNCAPSSA